MMSFMKTIKNFFWPTKNDEPVQSSDPLYIVCNYIFLKKEKGKPRELEASIVAAAQIGRKNATETESQQKERFKQAHQSFWSKNFKKQWNEIRQCIVGLSDSVLRNGDGIDEYIKLINNEDIKKFITNAKFKIKINKAENFADKVRARAVYKGLYRNDTGINPDKKAAVDKRYKQLYEKKESEKEAKFQVVSDTVNISDGHITPKLVGRILAEIKADKTKTIKKLCIKNCTIKENSFRDMNISFLEIENTVVLDYCFRDATIETVTVGNGANVNLNGFNLATIKTVTVENGAKVNRCGFSRGTITGVLTIESGARIAKEAFMLVKEIGTLTIKKGSRIGKEAFLSATIGTVTVEQGVTFKDHVFCSATIDTLIVKKGATIGKDDYSGATIGEVVNEERR